MKTTHMLNLSDVRRIARSSEQEAAKNGWPVSIAICDAGGHALWLERMDGAPPISAEVCLQKARASALLGKPSKALEDMVNGGRFAALGMPVLTMEGGEPIVRAGAVIGAVGVSGAKKEQDAQVARAGACTAL